MYLRPDIAMVFSALGGIKKKNFKKFYKICSINCITVKLLTRTFDLLLLVPLTGPLRRSMIRTTLAFSDLNIKLINT